MTVDDANTDAPELETRRSILNLQPPRKRLTIGSLMILVFAYAFDFAIFDYFHRHLRPGIHHDVNFAAAVSVLLFPVITFTAVYQFVPRPLDKYIVQFVFVVIGIMNLGRAFFGWGR